MKLVVDSNIVFSAAFNLNSNIARILLASKKDIQFYSCFYLRTELYKHRTKIISHLKITDVEFEELCGLVLNPINFVDEQLLPKETLLQTEQILVPIDLYDIAFVALAKHLNIPLWTGDKKLINGLKQLNYIDTLTTVQVLASIHGSSQ